MSESEQKVFGNQESGLASNISILSPYQKKRENCRTLLGSDFGCKSQGNWERQERFVIKPQAPLQISAVGSPERTKDRAGAYLHVPSRLFSGWRLGAPEVSSKQGPGN